MSFHTCGTCKKTDEGAPLAEQFKRCSKCLTVYYCSPDCQKSDWRAHKRSCGIPGNQSSSSNARSGADFMTALKIDAANCLKDLPEKQVFTHLIDSYRMRMEDAYVFRCVNQGIYAQESPLPGFRKFLRLAEETKVVPHWWNALKAEHCIELGMGGSEWSDLNCAVEKSDVMEHYKDHSKPMQLRMLAEKIYGSNVMYGSE